jgi:hypothetical protein
VGPTDNSFAYLAFDESSGSLLAHGSHAVLALADADRMSPSATIFVVRTGKLGEAIWKCGLSLALTSQLTKSFNRNGRVEFQPLSPITLTWMT